MNALPRLLTHPAFAEPAQRSTDRGGTWSSAFNVRVAREAGEVDRSSGDTVNVFRATLKCLASDVAAPAVGDTWLVPKLKGGAGVNWQAGVPVGHDGWWEIPLTRLERAETGGRRR